jgi:hypothetical protein
VPPSAARTSSRAVQGGLRPPGHEPFAHGADGRRLERRPRAGDALDDLAARVEARDDQVRARGDLRARRRVRLVGRGDRGGGARQRLALAVRHEALVGVREGDQQQRQ